MAHARKEAKRFRQLARRGRPRLDGPREIGTNRPQRETREEIMQVAKNAPHRREQPDPESPDHGHALGVLRRMAIITPEQEAAGNGFRRLARAFFRMAGGPRLKSANASVGASAGSLEPIHHEVSDEDRDQQLQERWDAAMIVLADCGLLTSLVFIRVCYYDRFPASPQEIIDLRRGLQRFYDTGLT